MCTCMCRCLSFYDMFYFISQFRVWVFSIGYTLCFAVILSKTWRIYYIFNNPTAKKKVCYILKQTCTSIYIYILYNRNTLCCHHLVTMANFVMSETIGILARTTVTSNFYISYKQLSSCSNMHSFVIPCQ